MKVTSLEWAQQPVEDDQMLKIVSRVVYPPGVFSNQEQVHFLIPLFMQLIVCGAYYFASQFE